jgi:hypothetical protein
MTRLEPLYVVAGRSGPLIVVYRARRRGVWGRAVLLSLALYALMICAVLAQTSRFVPGDPLDDLSDDDRSYYAATGILCHRCLNCGPLTLHIQQEVADINNDPRFKKTVGAFIVGIFSKYYRGPNDGSYCAKVTAMFSSMVARIGRICLERNYDCSWRWRR